jgi:hypothetical protein
MNSKINKRRKGKKLIAVKSFSDFSEYKVENKKTYSKKKKNFEFDYINNEILRDALERCDKVEYIPQKHITMKKLGYTSIHSLSKLAKRRWSECFENGGEIYIKIRSTNEPIYERILFNRKVSKFITKGLPLSKKIKPKKRGYIKNSSVAKVFGFDFYIQPNEKLKIRERKILLEESETYIGKILNEHSKNGGIENVMNSHLVFLDPSHSDIELISNWNQFFTSYGYRFKEFEKKWFKIFANDVKDDNPSEDTVNTELEAGLYISNKINLLKMKKPKYVDDMG